MHLAEATWRRVEAIAGCKKTSPAVGGSVRLRGGFGTPCDPAHTGFVEIFNAGEWGAICDGNSPSPERADVLADVVCRQLGFPHGTVVQANIPFNRSEITFGAGTEEADETQDRFWLVASQARCLGPEAQVADCDLSPGFRDNNSGCRNKPTRLTVACRTFAVPEALEAVTTPGAGTIRVPQPAHCVGIFQNFSSSFAASDLLRLSAHAQSARVCWSMKCSRGGVGEVVLCEQPASVSLSMHSQH